VEEQGLFTQILSRLAEELKWLGASVAAGKVGAGAVESQVQALLRETGREAAGVLLEAADTALCQNQKLHDRRTRTILTLFGPVDMTRGRTTDGHYPLDEALGLLGRHAWTQAVQEAASLLACEKGFASAGDLLLRLLGLNLSAPAVQQMAESAGARAALIQPQPPVPPAPSTAPPQTFILAVDGCLAPERDGWHEVKLACGYAHGHRARTASGRGKLLHKDYLATLEDAQAFGKELFDLAQRHQVGEGTRLVAMGDGAAWIWNLFALHFPGAIEIVDFYHAAEHLWATGEALYGDRSTSAATRSWVRYYLHHLRHGRVDLVIGAIARGQAGHPGRSPEHATVVRRNREYFTTNRQRMRYALFKRWRLPIGTGAVEGACKFVVQSRFKLPGCRWSNAGLTQMLALKQLRLNNRWHELWPFRKAA
jgi:hypothetical protein